LLFADVGKKKKNKNKNRTNYSPDKILEVNPRHPIIKELLTRVKNDASDETAKQVGELLYETALLTSGFIIEDPNDLASRVYNMINSNLNIDPSAAVPEEVEQIKEEKEVPKDEL
jgi:HSP90 family molecular chaperone